MVTSTLGRYAPHLALTSFTEETQSRLNSARVAVIGAGGLGSAVLLYIAAAGVGDIVLVDHDTVSDSNLQRQIIHTSHHRGELKVRSACRALAALNPDVHVTPISEHLTSENIHDVLSGVSLVIDCSDNFPTRFLLDSFCENHHIPAVWGSVSGFYGQVSVFQHHPSAGFHGPTLRSLYPALQEHISTGESQDLPDLPSPQETGTFGPLCGIVGSIMAGEALQVLGGFGSPLSGRLLLVDSRTMTFQEMSLEPPGREK